MFVKKQSGIKTYPVFAHKIGDIKGGVSIDTSELGGNLLHEGTPVSKPIDGVCHVIKVAVVLEKVEENATSIKVKKNHCLKAGDVVFTAINGKAVAVKSIRSNKDSDTLTLSEAIGTIEAGGFLTEAAQVGESGADIKYKPFALTGTSEYFQSDANLITDAWIVAVTSSHKLPDYIWGSLKCIINY